MEIGAAQRVLASLFAREGFEAIGTSSWATAASLGLRDGRHALLQETVDLVRRLTRNLNLPVSADIEAGYSETVEGVVESARAVLAAGAVGMNIEDSTRNPDRPLYDVALQCEKLSAVRRMADEMAFHPVLNARTDAFLLLPNDDRHGRLRETIERGRAHVESGR